MKDIKDYLHLYLGCDVEYEYKFTTQEGSEMRKATIIGFAENGITHFVDLRPIDKRGNVSSTGTFRKNIRDIKPILRPLSDMTKEEWDAKWTYFSVNIGNSVNGSSGFSDRPRWVLVLENRLNTNTLTFNDGMILLRMGFDLFGLIEAGIAIDKTKMS